MPSTKSRKAQPIHAIATRAVRTRHGEYCWHQLRLPQEDCVHISFLYQVTMPSDGGGDLLTVAMAVPANHIIQIIESAMHSTPNV